MFWFSPNWAYFISGTRFAALLDQLFSHVFVSQQLRMRHTELCEQLNSRGLIFASRSRLDQVPDVLEYDRLMERARVKRVMCYEQTQGGRSCARAIVDSNILGRQISSPAVSSSYKVLVERMLPVLTTQASHNA
jgi:hypothetical protein